MDALFVLMLIWLYPIILTVGGMICLEYTYSRRFTPPAKPHSDKQGQEDDDDKMIL